MESFTKETVTSFLRTLDHYPPDTNPARREKLTEALRTEFAIFNDRPKWFDACCKQSAAMAELSFHSHSWEPQLQIARFTWFMLYLDDLCHNFPKAMEQFQYTVLTDTSGKDTVLGRFREHLTDMYKWWDFLPANCIITGAMEYVNGCALEEMPVIQDMPLSHSAKSWPYYLRAKTGVAPAYAYMIFPRENTPNISQFIQVIGDINLFIDLTNDVLSFYKEYKAGETNNYVHNRAFVSQQSVQSSLQSIAREALAAHARITASLEDPEALRLWKVFANGYLGFHTTQPRYRLNELGI